jgi:hypothetical protein
VTTAELDEAPLSTGVVHSGDNYNDVIRPDTRQDLLVGTHSLLPPWERSIALL